MLTVVWGSGPESKWRFAQRVDAMSNESLSFSRQGIVQLKREEGVIDGLYDDASGYCTSGVGHLVHKRDKWPSFLLAAVRQNATWKKLVIQSGRTAYLPRATAFQPQFVDVKAAAVSIARHEISTRKMATDYEKLASTGIAKVDTEARAAIDTEAAALAQDVDVALRADLLPFEKAIRQQITVVLEQDEFDALVSFSFNVGAAAFASSTLVKKINTGRHLAGTAQERRLAIEAIDKEFAKWNKSAGRVLPGLTTRRAAEAARFLGRARKALVTAMATK